MVNPSKCQHRRQFHESQENGPESGNEILVRDNIKTYFLKIKQIENAYTFRLTEEI